MDDGRGIVPGILSQDRVIDHRLAEVPSLIAITHTGIDRIGEIAPHDVDLLPETDEYHRHPGVLAHGLLLIVSDVRILDQGLEDAPTEGRALPLAGILERIVDVG